MESLALVAVIVLFTSFVGGPVAILLTFLPDKPTYLRVFRTVAVVLLSLVGILFGYQLALSADIPAFPKLIGFSSVITSVSALLYEFKVLKHKNKVQLIENKSSGIEEASSQDSIAAKKLYAVIFKSKRQDANGELYYEHNDKLDEKIRSLAGYVKHSGMRHPETREGMTVAYFDSLEAIDQWRKDAEHMDAKKLAKSHFYENYSVEITEVIDSYGWNPEK
jgi:heme-degrading monooxygenase HmoA